MVFHRVCWGCNYLTVVQEDAQNLDLDLDLLIISCGIRPRDELARACDLQMGEGGDPPSLVVENSRAVVEPTVPSFLSGNNPIFLGLKV